MSTVWDTSDHHFGHKLVAGHRGFEDTREHDETIVYRHNKLVRPQDVVWFHGDLTLGDLDYAFGLVRRMNGRKQFIWGNHDAGWPGHKDAHRQVRRYLEVFESVQFAATRKFGRRKVMMTHMPYSGDHTADERYPEWRLPDTGMPLIHGHVHDKWLINGHQINVGLDVWDLQPVPMFEIVRWLQDLS
jgi:calcineurin-like phosphoesterase family protein